MKRKTHKKTFFQKRRTLKVYEALSLDLMTKLDLANTWTAESFLTSDYTYTDWMAILAPKKGEQLDDFIRPTYYESFCMATKLKVEPVSLEEQQQSLLAQAYEALDLYRKTKLYEHLRNYIQLFAEYKGLLQRISQKFRRIIGRIKARLRGRKSTDFRTQIRRFSRLIFGSTDDEEHINEFLMLLTIRFFILTMYYNVISTYFRYDKQPGVLFSGYQ